MGWVILARRPAWGRVARVRGSRLLSLLALFSAWLSSGESDQGYTGACSLQSIGVIGIGKIGQCAIDILLGFGCRILAFDKFPNAMRAE